MSQNDEDICALDQESPALINLKKAIDLLSVKPYESQCEVYVSKLELGSMNKYCEHLKRLDKCDLYMRFSCHICHDQIDKHVRRIYAEGAEVVALSVGGYVRGAVEIHYCCGNSNQSELAFSVEREFQGRGYGTLLMEAAIVKTRDRGINIADIICLPHNSKMQRLSARYAESYRECDDDIVISIDIAKASVLSRKPLNHTNGTSLLR